MRRSKKLQLGGHMVKIKWVDMSELEEESGGIIYGMWDSEENTIFLHEKRVNESPSQAQDTLIHECIHAIDDTYRLGLKHQTVHILGTALQQMLKPWLKKV